MFERFTDRARRVVVLAEEEARLLNHNFIGTEHILLGLIHEGEGVAAKALESLGISLEAVREKVEETIGPAGTAAAGHIPFTPRAKKVLELSLREALQLGHNYIGTEHLLLGLVREGEGVAAQVLGNLGVELDDVRTVVMTTLSVPQVRQRAVDLRMMLPDEFVTYLEWAIDDYAAELERNGKAVGEAAKVTSSASFDSVLPDGLTTQGHVLLVAADPDDGQRVGGLWFGPSTDDPAMAWVYDITVDEERRRQGWGRAIMRAFEGEARARGFARAGLNGDGDNHVARPLYESLGYVETAPHPHKELPGGRPLVS